MNKNIFKYIGGFFLAAATLTACSPEEFEGADPNGIPSMEGVDFQMSVDPETNTIEVKAPDMKGCYPLWYIPAVTEKQADVYSTLSTLSKSFVERGDYEITLRMANRNGFSQGSVKKKFHFDNSLIDLTPYISKLAGETSKTWRINYAEVAHLGCGESGTDGTNWWSAGPEDKKDWGVYDDRMTFYADGSYTYDPGAGGTVYVNKDCSIFPQYNTHDDNDFMAEVDVQNSKYEIEVNGDNINLKFPPQTLLAYVPNDDQYNNPVWRVESLSAKKMVLVCDNGNIAWHYILTSEEEAKGFVGFDYKNDANIWRPIDEAKSYTTSFWYAPGWNQIADPGFEHNGADYAFSLPVATTDEWQGQCFIIPNELRLEASKSYDFSCVINSNTGGFATVKMPNVADDGPTLFYTRVPLEAGKDYVFYITDCQGFDDVAKLVLDFGGCPDNTTVTISNITLKDHAIDDGTVLPEVVDPESDPANVNWGGENIGADFNTVGSMEFWWADAGWGQIGNPGFEYADGIYTITATENGGGEWQAQCSIHHANMLIEPEQGYDIQLKINVSEDVNRYTFKICDEGNDDNTLYYNGGLSLSEGDNLVQIVNAKVANSKGDPGFSEAKMFFDLGGITPGTVMKISEIHIQKHQAK